MRSRCLAVAIVFLSCGACWAQAKDWVALTLGPNQDLVTEKNGARTARIPLRYADAVASSPPPGLQVRISDVASKDGHGKQLASELKAEFKAADATRGMAVDVVVPNEATEVLPGPLAVSLQVSPDFNNPKESVQSLVVTLTAPAPQLRADAVVVGQVRGIVPFSNDQSNSGLLRLVESGGKAPLREITFSTYRDGPPTGQPDNGDLSFSAPPASLAPNTPSHITVAASGVYPLGKTTGKIELRSRDLSAPVVVPYEVRARRDPIWIIPLVAFGALIGYLVRTALTAMQARLAARLAASRTAELLDKEIAGSDDATYRKALKDLRTALARAVKQGDAKAITDEAKKAQDGLNAEKERFEQRLQPLMQQASALHTLVDRPWLVPSSAGAPYATLKEAAASVAALVARRNADGARDALINVVQPALVKTLNAVRGGGGDFAHYMSKLAAGAPPLVDADEAMLKQVADSLAKKFPWAAGDAVEATVEELSTSLSSLTSETSVCLKLLAQLSGLCDSFTGWAGSRLLGSEAASDNVFQTLRSKTLAALDAAQLRAEAGAALPPFEKIEERLRTVREDWRQYLQGKAPNVDTAAVDAALARGAWSEAIELAKAAMPKAPTALDKPAPAAAAPLAMPQAAAQPLPDAPPAPLGSPLGFSRASILLGTASEQDDLLRRSKWASGLQSVALAVLFTAGVFALYEEAWVGTGKEMLSLFMLAFGIDLTADSVLGAFKKLKMPEL